MQSAYSLNADHEGEGTSKKVSYEAMETIWLEDKDGLGHECSSQVLRKKWSHTGL